MTQVALAAQVVVAIVVAMVPVGAVVAGVALAAAAAQRRKRGFSTPPLHVAVLWVAALTVLWVGVTWGSTLMSGVCSIPALVLLFPWPITAGVLIPLGLPRTAYHMATCSTLWCEADHQGCGALAAALALMHKRRRTPQGEAFVAAQLATHAPLRGAGITALGVMAWMQGDVAAARSHFEAADRLPAGVMPALARRCAAEWLAAHAFDQGRWQDADACAFAHGKARSRHTRLLGMLARHHDPNASPPPHALLVLFWLWAPRRRTMWPLVRNARQPQPAPAASQPALEDTVLPAPSTRVAQRIPPLSRALALSAAAQHHPSLTAADLAGLAHRWDAALADAQVRLLVRQRGESLAVANASAVLQDARGTVETELARLARRAGLQLELTPASAGLLAGAARQLREDLLEQVEQMCHHLRARTDAEVALPPPDEWREWCALRGLFQQACALGGPSLQRLAFPTLNADLTHLAVWLWNVRKERTIAHEMFAFLLAQATHVGDARAAELHRQNVQCGVG